MFQGFPSKKTSKIKNSEALSIANKQLNPNSSMDELLKQAHALLKKFFETYKINKTLINSK